MILILSTYILEYDFNPKCIYNNFCLIYVILILIDIMLTLLLTLIKLWRINVYFLTLITYMLEFASNHNPNYMLSLNAYIFYYVPKWFYVNPNSVYSSWT